MTKQATQEYLAGKANKEATEDTIRPLKHSPLPFRYVHNRKLKLYYNNKPIFQQSV